MADESLSRKDRIRALLKSIETGDPSAIAVVDESRYIQHNPQTHEGSEGLAALFKRLAKTSPRVNVVRAFVDGDFVFAHTEYDFDSRRIGFEVFRFDGVYAVEHWDNIQPRRGPNSAGFSMVDGPVESADHGRTETNRELVKAFGSAVLLKLQCGQLGEYLNTADFIDHNPRMGGGLEALCAELNVAHGDTPTLEYQQLHRVLAEGNFVLSVSEGQYKGRQSAFYDLFRIADGLIVEHWDTTETITPRSEWKNNNGKF